MTTSTETTIAYLVRDGITGKETWTPGRTAREAVIAHENALRAAPDRHPLRPAQLLPPNSKATHGSTGRADVIDCTVGYSSCIGLPQAVRREEG